MKNTEQIISSFQEAAKLAGVDVPNDTISAEVLSKPHTQPKSLPKGKMAIYRPKWGHVVTFAACKT